MIDAVDRPAVGAPSDRVHPMPQTVMATSWLLRAPRRVEPADERFVRLAEDGVRRIPAAAPAALPGLPAAPPQAGAPLRRGPRVGRLPPTPATPATRVAKDRTSELAVLTVACRLGQPV